MRPVQRYHWWITGGMFVIALALYFTGFKTGAAMTVFLGFIAESVAWISAGLHPIDGATGAPKDPSLDAARRDSAS